MRKNSAEIWRITMTYKTILAKKRSCRIAGCLLAALLAASTLTYAQTAAVNPVVPNFVNYNGALTDASGKALTAISGVTFSLYKDSEGGAPLWLETQNIQPDSRGHFSVRLGSASGHGLPADLFASGEARWLGVQTQGQAEQPRVLLLSVPYALKAADAETLGGMPASAFVLAGSGTLAPAETGLKISDKSIISQASGQTFSGSGTGTITGVKAGTDLTGGGTTGKVVLNLDTTKVPQLATANTFAANQQIKGKLTVAQGFNVSGNSFINTSDGKAGLQVTQGGAHGGVAILGSAIATGSERNYGVQGNSDSTVAGSSGVLGLDGSTTGSGGFTIGVQGTSHNQTNGKGVFGFDGASLSSVFTSASGDFPAGVWGDGGGGPDALGVAGTVDDGYAGFFENNSSSGYYTLAVVAQSGASIPFMAQNAANGTGCTVDARGNLNCSGSKNAVVPVDGGKRIVAMSAIEAPQNWFEDFGSAQLVNGVAVVTLDQDFIQTVNSETNYKVFPVPNGECKGLYVTKKTANSFEVRELGGGTSNIGFDYRITVLRKNYERVRFADHTHDLDGMKRMQERMEAGTGKSVHLPTRDSQK
jgi:hypothetical protein